MPTRSYTLAILGLTLLLGCDDGGAPGDDPSDGGTTSDDASATAADEGQTADDDSGDGADSTGDDEPADGYPPQVLDHLDLPWPPYDYQPDLPAHFTTAQVMGLDNTPADNLTTDAGATLGRVLFHDRALSSNETIACASCHGQATGFSDTATFSEGFEGGHTGRNSMGLANSRFYAPGSFFWDERADTLEQQVLMPIQDPVEMGLPLDALVDRVQSQPYYPALFEQAFGDSRVDTDRIAAALAQYVRSIVSYRTEWDEGIAAAGNPMADFPNYDPQQNLGKALFFGQARCAVCHLDAAGPPAPGMPPGMPPGNLAVFMLDAPANNGLDADPNGEDNGVGDVQGDAQQNGDFKSPSLRNVAQTGPYMHDGRFETLEQVVEHYDSGVQDHPNLDPRLRNPQGQPQRLNLSEAERLALVAFMETLTDDALATDPRFDDPFRE